MQGLLSIYHFPDTNFLFNFSHDFTLLKNLIFDVKRSKICHILCIVISCLSILLHGVISLPLAQATLYYEQQYIFVTITSHILTHISLAFFFFGTSANIAKPDQTP